MGLWEGCLNVPVEDGKTCESQIDDGETAAIMGFVGTCLNALELCLKVVVVIMTVTKYHHKSMMQLW
jgi:hypothetical protein